jgi:uncharacterized protein
MKVSGTATLQGPVERVYQMLNDPAVLVRTLPGCERLEQVGPDAYRMTVTAGVAAIRGTFSGDVRLTDQQEPHSFVLHASGSGAPGTVLADVAVSLAANGDGTTQLSYDADAVVGGMVGGVGQRMLTGVARKTANEFFAAVNAVLTGTAVSPSPATPSPTTPGTAPDRVEPSHLPVTSPAATPATATAVPAAMPTSPAPTAAPPVFTHPEAAAPASRAGELWALVAAASLGAFATLAGIAVGWTLARSATRHR